MPPPDETTEREEPFGDAGPGATNPETHRAAHRRFQIHVLYVFVFSIVGIVILDVAYVKIGGGASILERLLTGILPVFTFLLGMGNSRDN
jgi:hypothetical protein